MGVLLRIGFSDRAAPIVAVQKVNGKTRLCADSSTGLNSVLELHQYSMPLSEDIFGKLNGGKFFSQIDLADAYLQVEVDDESKPLLTVNTHGELY